MRETVPSIYKLRKKLEEKNDQGATVCFSLGLWRGSGTIDLCALLNGYVWTHQIHKDFENSR